MKVSARIAILSLTYALMCLAVFLAGAFLQKNLPPLLGIDIFSYRFLTGLGHFFNWLPAILLSACLVGFSWGFGRSDAKNRQRFSAAQAKNFKHVLIVTVLCVIICFVVVEVFVPLVAAKKLNKEHRIADYTWFMDNARLSFKEKNIRAARFYAETALMFNPKSSEAVDLLERSKAVPLKDRSVSKDNLIPDPLPKDLENLKEDARAALNLLEQAREAFAQNNFFDAHYYAYWALKIAGANTANSAEMQGLAGESWNKLSTWSGFATKEAEQIFAQKRKAYASLMDGDFLTAYYIFGDLYQLSQNDPDILRYKKLATDALLKEYFFIDETADLVYFEGRRNINFLIPRKNGGSDKVHIEGLTSLPKTGGLIKYLRGLTYTSYDKDGRLLFSLQVPYAKMLAVRADAFGLDYKLHTELDDPAIHVPRLLLTAVDREQQGLVSSPSYISLALDGQKNPSMLLPMSLTDFNLVCDAAAGPQYMNFASLFQFVPKAQTYGMSAQLYGAFFIQRAAYPLALFAAFLIIAIFAWSYRLSESELFRIWWLFIFPLFTALMQLIKEFVYYSSGLVCFSLAKITGYMQLIAPFILLFVLILVFSIRFLSLRAEYPQDF